MFEIKENFTFHMLPKEIIIVLKLPQLRSIRGFEVIFLYLNNNFNLNRWQIAELSDKV